MTIADARRAHRPLSGVLTLCRCPHVIVLAACTVWQIAALTALTTAAHQGGSACPFKLLSDLLSDLLACHAVARMDSLGAIVIAPFIGFVLQAIGSYISIFLRWVLPRFWRWRWRWRWCTAWCHDAAGASNRTRRGSRSLHFGV
ncbi:hypothetical protein EIM45_15005 [Xanthomonas vasicola pv. musacearum]|uniref:hypothetical protein n=1 Tax=Xanthomonas vasicola TaxID=56459 RepID=UPI000F630C86|nr:hypothetical protein [Xanthomonas vasicola]RRJ59801.1 hypothetical protein EIM45_15005 [Xanthomonas vasicola pv. musacearum]